MSTDHDAPPSRPTRRDAFAWAREEAAATSAPDGRQDAATATEPQPQHPGPRPGPTEPPTHHDPAGTDQSPPPPRGADDSNTAAAHQHDPGAAPDLPRISPTAGPDPVLPPAPRGVEPRPDWSGHPLSASSIVRARRPRPREGWRAALYTVTGGLIAPRLSPAEVRRAEQVRRVRTPLPGPRRITVVSMKGGVGKTTVSSLLGLTLAEYRGDRAIAIDANPDAGTLADRLVGEGLGPTIRELINALGRVTASTELTRYTRLAGRLHVLPSEQDPAMSEQFNKAEYDAVIALLERFYDILITDSGTGVVHSAMSGALEHSDQLVIVGAPTVDAASRAAKTLDWLIEHDFRQLVTDSVVAISRDRESPDVDRAQIRDYFAERCRTVVEIPADGHLRTGGVIDLGQLSQDTLDGALELTAHVADGFHHHPDTPPGSHADLYPGQRR